MACTRDCATAAYSKSTRSAVINHSGPGRERERRLRKSTAPPINVNDLFLQRASRRITISCSVIAPVFLRLGLLFLFLPNETNFQRAQNDASRIQRYHRFIVDFMFSVEHICPFSTLNGSNKCSTINNPAISSNLISRRVLKEVLHEFIF